MNTKQCSKCQETKTLDQFYKITEHQAKRYSQKDGLDYYCKYCRCGTTLKSQRGSNKKKCTILECETHHYAKGLCRPHYARFMRHGTTDRKNKPMNTDKLREQNLRSKYLMTLAEYNEKSINGCEICGDKPESSLHVDHDHKCCKGEFTCGQCVRGIVCNKCNKLIDKYETGIMRPDNPLLDKVADYVIKYHHKRYNETNKHNAIIADNLEEFMAKLDGGRNG